jgi:hypothetical protein
MKKHEFSERKIKASDSLVNKTVLARYDPHGYYYEGTFDEKCLNFLMFFLNLILSKSFQTN